MCEERTGRVYLLKPVAKPASLQHGILFAATPQTSCSGSQLKVRSLPSIIPQGVLRSPFANLLKTVSPPASPSFLNPTSGWFITLFLRLLCCLPLTPFCPDLGTCFFRHQGNISNLSVPQRAPDLKAIPSGRRVFSRFPVAALRERRGGRAVLRGGCGCADRWGPPCLLPNGSGLCARRKRLQTVQDKTRIDA